jgi:RNA polymerase sigma factor (sigma-70 family)
MSVFMARAWHRLLSAEEEQELGRRIDRGRRLSRGRTLADVPTAELREWLRAVRTAKEAADDLAVHNLRLVYHHARRRPTAGMEVDDLFQEGYIGLRHAITKWEPDRMLRLSTYGTWWIRQSLSRAIADRSRIIRFPVHLHENLRRLELARESLGDELGREPASSEIAMRLGADESEADRLFELQRLTVVSLDELLEQGDAGLVTTIAISIEDPDVDTSRAVWDVLASLNDREADVITMRYGLLDNRERTLEEVGREFGVTRERIRQIEAKVFAKLRQSRQLEPYRPSAVELPSDSDSSVESWLDDVGMTHSGIDDWASG